MNNPPAAPAARTPASEMAGVLRPRPHQAEAIAAACTELERGTRATVVAACGTGKTLIAAETARTLPAARVLVAVPTLDLLAQTERAWQQAGRSGRAVAVCGTAEALHHHATASVTTDPAELARLTAGPGEATVYCTYASLPAVAAAHRDHRLPAWNLLVIDEAHRTAGLLGKAWGAIHDDGQIPAGRRLYLTATPRIVDSDDQILASMDDEGLYGPIVYRLDTGDAISAGLLADYEVLVPVISDADLRARLEGEDSADARTAALQVAILKACHERRLTRVLTYHRYLGAARRFAETLPGTAARLNFDEQPPALWSGWISGRHTPAERRRLLAELADPRHRPAVLSNVRVLGEGVDMPTLDAVTFADPKASVIEIVQAVGRALRLPPGSGKKAAVIVPVMVGPEDEPENILDSSAFTPLWRTLRALRAHDGRIADRIGELRTAAPSVDYGQDTVDWLTVIGTVINPRLLAAAIQVRTVGTKSAEWRRGYAAAVRFHGAHGHLDVAQTHVDEYGVALGSWVSYQRFLHGTQQIQPARQALLEELGIDWKPRASQWETSLGYAQRYAAQHGHLVPEMGEQLDRFPLGRWLRNLRVRADAGEVPAERIAQLKAIDPQWNPPWRTSWQRAFYQAADFRAKHGHLDVPASYRGEDGTELGTWLKTQRGSKDALLPEQVALLDKLGMDWDAVSPHERAWQRGLKAARAFAARESHLRVPRRHTETVGGDEVKLGVWIGNLRLRRDKITPDRQAVLDELGMIW